MKKNLVLLVIGLIVISPMFFISPALADDPEPTPTPIPMDSIMLSTLSPNINGQVTVSGQTVNFLTYQFGEGGLLLSKVKTGVVANGITGGLLAGTPDWSYKIMEGKTATYHTIQIPAGNWFVVPFTVSNGQVYYGTEFEVK